MADFCKQCSIDYFGEDNRDLADRCREGRAESVICEGCGFIVVNKEGECIYCDLKKGQPGHGPLDKVREVR